MKKLFIGAAFLSFAAILFFVSKNNSLSNILESNVDALVEVANAEYKIKCNGSTETVVQEYLETYDWQSTKMGYVDPPSQNKYCGVKDHYSCSLNQYKCHKSNHTSYCYHPHRYPSSSPL